MQYTGNKIITHQNYCYYYLY